MIRKAPALFVTGALAMLALSGCHNSTTDTGGGPAPAGGTAPAGGGTSLAFVTNNASDYWNICHSGVLAAQKELPGINVQWIEPDDGTAATQKRDVDDLLAKGVKGIAISPVDPANETDYLNTVAAKASLITSDSDAAKSNRLCYIGTDNEKAGEMAGDLIKKAIPKGGKIMLFVGKTDAQNAHDRILGIQTALKGSNITVVDTRTDDTDHARAKANAADALVKTPDLACLVGIWSYNGPAIASAVQDANKTGKVKIVCFDQEQGTVDGIRSGAIYGTIVQDPYTFGYSSIKLLAAIAQGDKSGIPANKLKIIPTQEIIRTNLDQYLADQKKKLGG